MKNQESIQRIPLNTFAIAFGLAGLADVWMITTATLALPRVPSIMLSVVAAISWVWLIVAHIRRGARSSQSLLSQLQHPVQGPIAALVPIVGMLLAAASFPFAPTVGRMLVVAFIVITAVFAAWLVSSWLVIGIPVDSIHGGYYLPTVAGGLIAATTAAEVGLPTVAIGAFAVGIFMWVIMTAIILARQMFGPALPAPLVPTLAIFVAPPAVAGTAWFLITGTDGPVEFALAGLTAVMVLIQLALLPRYRQLTFTLGFWSFTFPFAAVVGYGIQWLTFLRPTGWQVLVVALAIGVTALVVAVAITSVRIHRRETRTASESPLTTSAKTAHVT